MDKDIVVEQRHLEYAARFYASRAMGSGKTVELARLQARLACDDVDLLALLFAQQEHSLRQPSTDATVEDVEGFLEDALCAPSWAKCLASVHDAKAALQSHSLRADAGERDAQAIKDLAEFKETQRYRSSLFGRMEAERDKLREALIRIAKTDRHRRYPKPHPDGGIRGVGGMIAVFELTGKNGCYLTDADLDASITDEKSAG